MFLRRFRRDKMLSGLTKIYLKNSWMNFRKALKKFQRNKSADRKFPLAEAKMFLSAFWQHIKRQPQTWRELKTRIKAL